MNIFYRLYFFSSNKKYLQSLPNAIVISNITITCHYFVNSIITIIIARLKIIAIIDNVINIFITAVILLL